MFLSSRDTLQILFRLYKMYTSVETRMGRSTTKILSRKTLKTHEKNGFVRRKGFLQENYVEQSVTASIRARMANDNQVTTSAPLPTNQRKLSCDLGPSLYYRLERPRNPTAFHQSCSALEGNYERYWEKISHRLYF